MSFMFFTLLNERNTGKKKKDKQKNNKKKDRKRGHRHVSRKPLHCKNFTRDKNSKKEEKEAKEGRV